MRTPLLRYGLSEMLECASISADQYIIRDSEGKQIRESAEKFFDYIPRIAKTRKLYNDKPYMKEIYRLLNIMRSMRFYKDYRASSYLEQAYLNGIEIYELEGIIRSSRNWSTWMERMEDLLNG